MGTTWPVPVSMPLFASGVGRRGSLSASQPWKVTRMRSRPSPGRCQAVSWQHAPETRVSGFGKVIISVLFKPKLQQ